MDLLACFFGFCFSSDELRETEETYALLEDQGPRIREVEAGSSARTGSKRPRRRIREEVARVRERERRISEEAAREREARDRERRIREEAARELEARERERRIREEALDKALQGVIDETNFYIRTRNRFDSSDPRSYSCGINGPKDCQDVMTNFELYNFRRRELQLPVQTFREFVASCHHFKYYPTSQTIRVAYLTPFQGADSHRVFGYFECSGATGCGRSWRSGSSWKDKWQKCQECERKCYPYNQHALARRDDDEPSLLPHQRERCEKCIELGRLCAPGRFYAV